MQVIEQADRTGGQVTYSWMLSRGYNTRKEMEGWGWKWIRGNRGRGTFVTNNIVAVFKAVVALNLPAPVSNGSHALLGVPMAGDT